jgi:ABC-type transporter Mla MlaB component
VWLQLRARDDAEAGAGTFGLLRVSVMRHPTRTCVKQRQDELVVQACGSLSLHSSDDESPLDVVGDVSRVAWDLSLVTDLDAAGVGALAGAVRRAIERGGSVYIHAASPVVQRLAALARIDTKVPGAWEARVAATPLCSAPCPIDGEWQR